MCPEESNCLPVIISVALFVSSPTLLMVVVVFGVVVVAVVVVTVAVAATQKGPLNPGLHLHFVSYGLEFST